MAATASDKPPRKVPEGVPPEWTESGLAPFRVLQLGPHSERTALAGGANPLTMIGGGIVGRFTDSG